MAQGNTHGRDVLWEKLTRNLQAELRSHSEEAPVRDPVVDGLTRVFAAELADIYADQERVRESLLDELMLGLDIEPRRARPAQAALQVAVKGRDSFFLEAGQRLTADTPGRQEFRTDFDINASQARVAAALAYQNNVLAALSPTQVDCDPFPGLSISGLRLGMESELFLAIENTPAEGFTALSIQIETAQAEVQAALARGIWRLAMGYGDFPAFGILRSFAGPRGVRQLCWGRESGRGEQRHGGRVDEATLRPVLPDGPLSGSIFIMPSAEGQSGVCRLPRVLQDALQKQPGVRAQLAAFGEDPRLWIRVSLGSLSCDLAPAIRHVRLHVVTASNVEELSRPHQFSTQGTSFPVEGAGAGRRLLVAPKSIIGSQGSVYCSAFAPSQTAGDGRYFIRRGRIDLEPARRRDGSVDDNLTVSLWVTEGSAANGVKPGQLRKPISHDDGTEILLQSLISTRGGQDGEPYATAATRFASAVLTRGRLVTLTDLRVASKAFDDRVLQVEAAAGLRRGMYGLQRVHRVEVTFDQGRFPAGAEERTQLVADLEEHLQRGVAFDVVVQVVPRWTDTEPAGGA